MPNKNKSKANKKIYIILKLKRTLKSKRYNLMIKDSMMKKLKMEKVLQMKILRNKEWNKVSRTMMKKMTMKKMEKMTTSQEMYP